MLRKDDRVLVFFNMRSIFIYVLFLIIFYWFLVRVLMKKLFKNLLFYVVWLCLCYLKGMFFDFNSNLSVDIKDKMIFISNK